MRKIFCIILSFFRKKSLVERTEKIMKRRERRLLRHYGVKTLDEVERVNLCLPLNSTPEQVEEAKKEKERLFSRLRKN